VSRSLLADAFEHHNWATLRLLDTCADLDPVQLDTTVPGTFGSIIDTMRHLVGADSGYLFVVTMESFPILEEEGLGLAELRSATERHGLEWTALLQSDVDPERVMVRHRDDGSEGHATLGVRLAQVIHHGTDHRSQICTALTSLGIEPPEIDVWEWALQVGRFRDVPAAAAGSD